MKTDTLFYQLFQTFPRCFFDLLNLPPENVNHYQFSSVEVKQLAFRLDGVFLPDSSNQPIWETSVYQEALEEGLEKGKEEGKMADKLASIPRLLLLGLSLEQIAQAKVNSGPNPATDNYLNEQYWGWGDQYF